MKKEKFTFFWGGEFSQWYDSPMTIRGVDYSCAEQYMMAEKARLFGDAENEARIMATTSPSEQKMYGRCVKGFDKDLWEKHCKRIVYIASWEKYTQNPELMKLLLATEGTTIVEASPWDRIWGIGLKETDPRCLDRNEWRGTNWLGQVLMQVRDEFIKHGKEDDD